MKKFTAPLVVLFFSISFNISASVVIGGTRLVFNGGSKEISLSVENRDSAANLVQSWITPADATTPGKQAMIITPPLFRLNAGEKNVIRIVRSGLPMPEDHESMYWLNVKGIAATSGNPSGSNMQIAINSRIKLIYRPLGLKGTFPEDVTTKLVWSVADGKLQVNNPTNYYMNFAVVKINQKDIENVTWVGPKATAEFPLPARATAGKISWRIYNDFGMAGAEHHKSL
jgi:P pilus assembly protein, chaperone PapD